MLSIEQCRALLSTESELSDTEKVSEIRDELYRLSELAFEIYWSDVESGSKNPFGLLNVGNASDNV